MCLAAATYRMSCAGISRKLLLRCLWGDHFINLKSKRIFTSDKSGNLTPMFVQFVLKNIWDVYNAVNEKYHHSDLSSLRQH